MGEQVIYPDTGLPAWWCICVEHEGAAQAFGPFRTQAEAQAEADGTTGSGLPCDAAHFTATHFGSQMAVRLPCTTLRTYNIWADFAPVKDALRALVEGR